MVAFLISAVILTSGAGRMTEAGPAFRQAAEPTQSAAREDRLVSAKRRPRRPPPRAAKEPAPSPEAAAPPAPAPAEAAVGGPAGRSTRIEFEGQLIKGQTTKAGEVQILERRDSEMKSMVKRRTSFREEIIKSVFPVTP